MHSGVKAKAQKFSAPAQAIGANRLCQGRNLVCASECFSPVERV